MKEREPIQTSLANGKVKPELIPDWELDVMCSVLDDCVRRLFEQPGIQAEYEAWLKDRKRRGWIPCAS